MTGIPFIGGAHPCKLDNETEIVDLDPAAFPVITNNGVPFLSIRQAFGVLSLDYNLTPEIKASSTTTYYRNRTHGMISGTYPGAAASLWANNNFYRRDVSEEIRIQSDYTDKPLNWLIGGYYQNARMKNDIVIGWNQKLTPILSAINPALALPAILDQGTHDVHIDSKSLFGQLRWKPAEQLLSGWLEGMLPAVKPDKTSDIAVDANTFEKGLAAVDKDNDRHFPPDWRMSYKGRAEKQ